jgi:hypothetical protein
VEFLFGQGKSVGYHAPWIATLLEGTAYVCKVFAHEGFTAGNDDQHFVWIDMRRNLRIDDPKEIFCGHVGCLDGSNAIAAAMQAMHIAAERGLPEELSQRVDLFEITAAQSF